MKKKQVKKITIKNSSKNKKKTKSNIFHSKIFLFLILFSFVVLIYIIILVQQKQILNQNAATITPTRDSIGQVQQKSRVSSLSWSHTVGNVSNRLLVVGISVSGGKTVSSVTYGSQALTRYDNITYESGAQDDELWYTTNPTIGKATITVDLSGSTNVVADSVSFYNVNQITPFSSEIKASGTGKIASISVTGDSNELVLDVLAADSTKNNFSASSGQTTLWNGFSNSLQNGASTRPSSGSVTTMTWTNKSSVNWADIAAAVLPIVVLPTPSPTTFPTPTGITSLSQAPTTVPSGGASGSAGISVNGVSLMQGNTRFILKGVNLEYYRDSGNPSFMSSEVPLSSQIVAKMKSLGINAVRLDYTPAYVNQGSNMTNYLAMVKLLATNGIYVMPCDHTYTGNPISGYTTTSFPDFKTIITYAQQQGISNYLVMNPYNEPYSSDDASDWIAANEATLQYFRTTLGFNGVVVLDTTAWATTDNTSSFQTIMNYDASLLGGKSNVIFSNHEYPKYNYQTPISLSKQYPLLFGELGNTTSGSYSASGETYVDQVLQSEISTGIPNGNNGVFPWVWWWTDGNQMTNDGLTLNSVGQDLVTNYYNKVTN